MISGRLKRVLYAQKIRRLLNTKTTSLKTSSGKAGLIIDAEDLNKEGKLAEFYRLAAINKEDFRVVVCSSDGVIPVIPGADILLSGEVSLTGKFRNQAIQDFAEENLDFIICHFSKNNDAACLLAVVSRAVVKIGNSPDQYGIYTIEIDTGDIEIFQQEALKYLKILKKTN